MNKVKTISVIGLGKLGLCSALCFASKGYKVIGVDVDKNRVDLINQGKSPIKEEKVPELLSKCRKNFTATCDYKQAILAAQVSFIIVPTPSDAQGFFSNKYLEEALTQIAYALKEKSQYHLVVITSTVMPGTSEHVAKYLLENISGKKCGRDFGIAYNPEFIALGSVIHDFLNPDFLLIGQLNQADGKILEEIYKRTCDNQPKFAHMNTVNAEIAKISLNCYVTMKITYANSLAAICEKVKGANAAVIAQGIGLDSRIGRKYLKPGLGYGGPCFPRDNIAFAAFADTLEVKAKLAKMVDEVNKDQVVRIVNMVKEVVNKSKAVGVLGLAYKPNTPIIEDSQAIDIVELLINEGYKVTVYDPLALESAKSVLGDKVYYAKNQKECYKRSNVVVIATPWSEFRNISLQEVKNIYIIDCWGLLKDHDKGLSIKYLGEG